MTPEQKALIRRLVPAPIIKAGIFVERMLIRTVRAFTPGRLPKNVNGEVRLNLGSGGSSHPSFINIDAAPSWTTHYIQSITNLRRYADNSVALIYASHCLEHISHRQTETVLGEWYRVLRPDGILRLGVPDFDQLVAYYQASGDIENIQGILSGGQDYPLNMHLRSFTEKSLTTLLKRVGFREVRRWQYGSEPLTSLNDCTNLVYQHEGRDYQLSLNLEAVK